MPLSKIRSGIDGFDELVNGGLPRGQSVLVTGGTGTGKSTLAMQFVYRGAKVYDEPGIYVTLEETVPSILRNTASYGWDIESLQKKDKIALLDVSPAVSGQLRRIEVTDVFSNISTLWKKLGAKRIVIDPITVFGMQAESQMQLRQDLIRFSSLLKQLDATIMFVTEIPEENQGLSRYGIEEFIADGVVVLYYSRVGGLRVRGIEIRKMRGTSHKEGTFPIKIGETGLVVYPSGKIPKLT
ncbi:MAG: AAA family ATPase [Nitrososphaerota archaeon]|nr:AAA family ATPase [Nitrososphaerota archaeon]